MSARRGGRIEDLDRQIRHCLEQGCEDRRRRPELRDRAFAMLWGPVQRFALHDLETWKPRAPVEVRYDAAATWGVALFQQAIEHLEDVQWQLGDGFGIVDPRRVKDPSNLRRCLTAAVIREARRECDRWLRELPLDPATAAGSTTAETPPPLGPDPDQVLGAYGRLPPELREPFVFHCVVRLPLRSVARIIGTSHVEVSRRVQAARTLLKRFLRDE